MQATSRKRAATWVAFWVAALFGVGAQPRRVDNWTNHDVYNIFLTFSTEPDWMDMLPEPA